MVDTARVDPQPEPDNRADRPLTGRGWVVGCPTCSGQGPKPAVGPSAASGGQMRAIPGHEGDSTYTAESTRTGDSGKPEALTGRGWLIECPECHRSCLVTREEIMSGSWLRTPCPHCTGGAGKEAT